MELESSMMLNASSTGGAGVAMTAPPSIRTGVPPTIGPTSPLAAAPAPTTSNWRPTRKMFVPSVPLVPRNTHATTSMVGGQKMMTSSSWVTSSMDPQSGKHTHPEGTNQRSIKQNRISEMLLEQERTKSFNDVLNGFTNLENDREPFVFDTQSAGVASSRARPTRPKEDADRLPPLAVPHSAREMVLADRLMNFEHAKSVKPMTRVTQVNAPQSNSSRRPVPPRLAKIDKSLIRKYKDVELHHIVRDHEARNREEKELADAIVEAENLKNVEAAAANAKKEVWVNPSAKLGSHLVTHAQNIVNYTYNLMDATARRVNNRQGDEKLSFKDARKVQLVNVLRKNKLAEDPMAPPPAIAILTRDERSEALQAKLKEEMESSDIMTNQAASLMNGSISSASSDDHL